MAELDAKNEIIKIVETFGLYVDLDRWDYDFPSGSGWMRIQSKDWPNDFGYKNNCLILYKDDFFQGGIEFVKNELIQSLIHLGKNLKAKEIRKNLNLI